MEPIRQPVALVHRPVLTDAEPVLTTHPAAQSITTPLATVSEPLAMARVDRFVRFAAKAAMTALPLSLPLAFLADDAAGAAAVVAGGLVMTVAGNGVRRSLNSAAQHRAEAQAQLREFGDFVVQVNSPAESAITMREHPEAMSEEVDQILKEMNTQFKRLDDAKINADSVILACQAREEQGARLLEGTLPGNIKSQIRDRLIKLRALRVRAETEVQLICETVERLIALRSHAPGWKQYFANKVKERREQQTLMQQALEFLSGTANLADKGAEVVLESESALDSAEVLIAEVAGFDEIMQRAQVFDDKNWMELDEARPVIALNDDFGAEVELIRAEKMRAREVVEARHE